MIYMFCKGKRYSSPKLHVSKWKKYHIMGSFGSIYEMEREWIQIEEGNGNKNGCFYWVFGSSQVMKIEGNHYLQVMDFVTWGEGKVTKWENPLLLSNGKGLMWGWTKQEERESVIESISWNLKIMNQTTHICSAKIPSVVQDFKL